MSVLGVYVVTDRLPPLDDDIELSFSLPGDPEPIRCRARVAWQNPPSIFKGCGAVAAGLPPGCGLAFLGLSAEDRDRIDSRIRATRTATV